MFIFQGVGFKVAPADTKEDPIKKTSLLTGGAIKMEWDQLERNLRTEASNKYDNKTTETIVQSAKKLWQNNDYDGLQKLLKTWELTETLKYVQKEIETQKTKSQPKGGGAQKIQTEQGEDKKKKDRGRASREKDLAQAPKTKTPGEEQAEQAQNQRPPEEKKDAPATDFFTKPKQE